MKEFDKSWATTGKTKDRKRNVVTSLNLDPEMQFEHNNKLQAKYKRMKEDVMFDVFLKNVSNRHMIVKSLGKDSLFFLINNQTWGTSPLSGKAGGSDVILKSGEETHLRLKGESFQKAQMVEITAFYGMVIEGVNPMGKAKVMVQE